MDAASAHQGKVAKLAIQVNSFLAALAGDVYTLYEQKERGMAEAVLDIKHWGNNLGVRLPAAVAREANLHVDQRVRVSVDAGRVVITPIANPALTLEQRLASFDPARHGGEAMTGASAPPRRIR
jgi:antitoxin MazE